MVEIDKVETGAENGSAPTIEELVVKDWDEMFEGDPDWVGFRVVRGTPDEIEQLRRDLEDRPRKQTYRHRPMTVAEFREEYYFWFSDEDEE